jgi:hypothetical protein
MCLIVEGWTPLDRHGGWWVSQKRFDPASAPAQGAGAIVDAQRLVRRLARAVLERAHAHPELASRHPGVPELIRGHISESWRRGHGPHREPLYEAGGLEREQAGDRAREPLDECCAT